MEEYTIKEFAVLNGYKLKPKTRMMLGRNAVKIEKSLKLPIEKKYNNKERCYRSGSKVQLGVRIWPISILNEVFPKVSI